MDAGYSESRLRRGSQPEPHNAPVTRSLQSGFWAPNQTGSGRLHTRARQGISLQSGFSLIELLVVILIIGILAALAIPRFLGQRSAANDAKTKVALRAGLTAAETHFSRNQTYLGLETTLNQIEPSLTIDNTPFASLTVPPPGPDAQPTSLVTNGFITRNFVYLCAGSRSGHAFCAVLNTNGATLYYKTINPITSWTQFTGPNATPVSVDGWP